MLNTIKHIKIILNNKASLIKTIYYNFKYLPLKQASKLPMIIFRGVSISGKGRIVLKDLNKMEQYSIYVGGRALQWMPSEKICHTVWKIDGVLQLGKSFYFGCGGAIEVGENGELRFEENFNSTGKCTIICRNNIQFKKDVLVSWNTLIMDSDQHTLLNENGIGINFDDSIVIGNHVWISCNVTILKKSYINDNCVVGCNSLIQKKYNEKNVVIAGNQAIVCKEKINWSYDKPKKNFVLN